MLCEECKAREATYTVSVLMGEESTTRHLCEECMSKMKNGMTAENIRHLLSSILSAITGGAEAPAEEQPDAVCPSCGMTLSRFTRSGRLGCAACYQAFREQLQPMLMQIHGRTRHVGRKPLASVEAQHTRTRREVLTQQMAQAVALEDFETAAALRDQLRALGSAEEADKA